MLDQVRDVVAVAVPVVARIVAALGDDHGPAALGEEEEREARGHHRILDAAAAKRARERVLRLHEHLRAFEIPVGLTDESAGREPPHPLEPIQIIEVPGLSAAGIFEHGEPLAQPVEAALEHLRRRSAAAAGDRLAPGLGIGRADVLAGDPDARDAGARHAAGAAAVADRVAPGAVAVGARHPVLMGQFPGRRRYPHARAIRLVEREQGELRVGVVPRALRLAVRP